MADKPQNNQMSDYTMFTFIGFIFVTMIINKIFTFLHVWIREPKNQLILVAILVFTLTPLFYFLTQKWTEKKKSNEKEKGILGKRDNSVYCGKTDKKEPVFIKTSQRISHTQVIGTTNAGKTESVILPWAIQDIEQGRGLILIDGKADSSLLKKLWAYTLKHNRANDFRLLSLSNIEESFQFNPLIGRTPEEVVERVFNSFEFENEYYKDIQFEIFSQIIRLFYGAKVTPTFAKVYEVLLSPNKLKALAIQSEKVDHKAWADHHASLSASELEKRTSGLKAKLSHFVFGQTAKLFNTESPSIDLNKALSKNQIVYFQLPVMLSPFLGKVTGKLVLQCLQSAIAERHNFDGEKKFYSVFLDDFTEYLYPGFLTILNKSRSANVGVVFAHQSLGDIKTVGDAISTSILTNANMKIFMRCNDPDSAEYYSKSIGTVKNVKLTSKTKKGLTQHEETGDGTMREVDEFLVHPNTFKTELGVGQAVMVIPHENGTKAINLKFQKFDDLEPVLPLLKVPKFEPLALQIETPKVPTNPGSDNEQAP